MDPQLGSSRLVRLLRTWGEQAGTPSQQDVAERLGHWLGAFDAIKLDGTLHSLKSGAPVRPATGVAVDVARLERIVDSATAELHDLIDSRLQPAASVTRALGLAEDEGAAVSSHAMHQQRYLDAQQQVGVRLAQCRAQLRQSLSQGGTQWRQLALLDAAMEQMLGRHEQKLWATVTACLERRFEHWRQNPPRSDATVGPEEDSAAGCQPGGGLHAYEQDQRALLRAEMEVRLQPILGLLEAARNEHREHA